MSMFGGAGFDDVLPPAAKPKRGAGGVRPQPPVWIKDSSVDGCQTPGCTVTFEFQSLFERRHHCRYCGKIFCDKCSSFHTLMPPHWEGAANFATRDPQRCCEGCKRSLAGYQSAWIAQNCNANRSNALALDDYSTRYLNMPLSFTLGGEVRKAAYSLRNLRDGVNFWSQDVSYFDNQLFGAHGLLFLTMAKFAFLGGLRVGTGLVVAKLADGSWSAPCAVGSFGVSFGAALGAEITDMITPVDSRAIEEFCNANTSKVSMGGEASLAFGPVGRTASGDAFFASDASVAGATSYSQSRGFYGGVTLDGAYLKVRDDVNLRFYGGGVTAASLLRGQTRQPNAAQPLYEQLHEFYTMLDQRQRSLNASDLRKLQDSRGQSVRAPPHDANPWGAFEAQPPRVERPPPMQQAYQPPMQQAPAYVPQPTTDSMFFSTPLFAAAPPGTKPRNANSGVVEV